LATALASALDAREYLPMPPPMASRTRTFLDWQYLTSGPTAAQECPARLSPYLPLPKLLRKERMTVE
jgi:hypothetical protein